MPDDSWTAYESAVVRLHLPRGLTIVAPDEPGVAHGEFPAVPAGKAIAVLTAHNPGGIEATVSDNARAHRRLVEYLDRAGVDHVPGAGGDPAWSHIEESVAIVGTDVAMARRIGRDFDQDAIFVWTADAWAVVSCTTDAATRLGWRILDQPETARRVDLAYRQFRLDSPYVPVARAQAAAERVIEATTDPEEVTRLEQLALAFTQEYWRLADARGSRDADRRRRARLPLLEDAEASGARHALAPILEMAASGAFDPDVWVPAAVKAIVNAVSPTTRALTLGRMPLHLLDLWDNLCAAVERGDSTQAEEAASLLSEQAKLYAQAGPNAHES